MGVTCNSCMANFVCKSRWYFHWSGFMLKTERKREVTWQSSWKDAFFSIAIISIVIGLIICVLKLNQTHLPHPIPCLEQEDNLCLSNSLSLMWHARCLAFLWKLKKGPSNISPSVRSYSNVFPLCLFASSSLRFVSNPKSTRFSVNPNIRIKWLLSVFSMFSHWKEADNGEDKMVNTFFFHTNIDIILFVLNESNKE